MDKGIPYIRKMKDKLKGWPASLLSASVAADRGVLAQAVAMGMRTQKRTADFVRTLALLGRTPERIHELAREAGDMAARGSGMGFAAALDVVERRELGIAALARPGEDDGE